MFPSKWTELDINLYTHLFHNIANCTKGSGRCYVALCYWKLSKRSPLTHWGRVTHICVGKLIIIGSDNGLSPDRRQAIIWTNAGLLSIGLLRTYFSENLIEIQQFSLKKMHVKVSSAKWRPSCLGLNVLTGSVTIDPVIVMTFLFYLLSYSETVHSVWSPHALIST